MIKETISDPEKHMRVFSDTDCTTYLKVWYEEGADMKDAQRIREFHLVYNALQDAHSILWRRKQDNGQEREVFAHTGIDDGESKTLTDRQGNKVRFSIKQSMQPVLNGVFEERDVLALARDFLDRSPNIEYGVVKFIHDKLLAFPPEQFVHRPHE
jgi:hypothetical protein